MTEDEARVKWCPYAMTVGGEMTRTGAAIPAQGGAFNRIAHKDTNGFTVPVATKCIASACMAWRWRKIPNPAWKDDSMLGGYPRENPYSREPTGIDSTTDGYCGLAGQS
jgi:hypothetical protein